MPGAVSSAAVLVPTWNGMEFLERVLDALAAQETDLDWHVHVVDSGSSDGTVECIERRAPDFPVPLTVRVIPQLEFDHGDTRNMLAAESTGELLVFLSQDAIPSRSDWLATLAKNFDDPRVGAAYCRNVPRPESHLLTKVFSRSDPGYAAERREVRLPDEASYLALSSEERRQLYNFNNVASAARRELWERHPFPRTMMGEDVLLGRGILEAGYTVVYDAEATVDHSHDYAPEKMHWRGEVDARFCAEWLNRICVREAGDVEELATRLVAADLRALRDRGVAPHELRGLESEALELRRASVQGLFDGSQAQRRYPRSVMRERPELRVVFATPEEPTEDVRRLVGALRARGHAVEVAAGSSALEAVLDAEAPDVVHFAPLVPALAAGVERARALRVATVAEAPGDFGGERGHLDALATTDLQLTGDAALRERYLEAGEFDAHAFLCCSRLEPARTDDAALADLAAELEFRYRGAACIDRIGSHPYGVLLDVNGENFRTSGDVVRQGAGWVLLRRGSRAELDVSTVPAGTVTLELEQPVLAAEPKVRLSGELLLDGETVGTIPAPAADGTDRVESFTLELELPPGARTLELRPRPEHLLHRKPYLRIARLRLRAAGGTSAAYADRGQVATRTPRPDLEAHFETLRVEHGPALAPSELPTVAIVVPNLDGAAVLPDCLASLGALDRERVSVHVVDNGSSDDSVAIVRRDLPWAKLHELDHNTGFAAACNLGAARAATDGAEVVVFLNNDVRFEPAFLPELVSPVARRQCTASSALMLSWNGERVDWAGTGSNLFGTAVQPGFGEPPGPEHHIPRRTLFPCGGAMAIRADAFAEVGGFDESFFAYYEDLDLGWRLNLLGHDVHFTPSAVCRHHHSHTSRRLPEEALRRTMIRNSALVCLKNWDDPNLGRVFPALVALALRRANLRAGLDQPEFDESAFRIESATVTQDSAAASRGPVPIDRLGAADLLALQDVLDGLEATLEKRKAIQSRRARPDAEVLPLLVDPSFSAEGDPSYERLQRTLFRWLGLDELD